MTILRTKGSMLPLFILAVVVGGCARGGAEKRIGTATPTVTVEPSETPEAGLLATVPISEPPKGMVFDAEDLGDAARDHLLDLSPSEVVDAVQVGWVDGVLRQYWSPDFMEDVFSGNRIPPKRFERSGYWTVLSGAALYQDPQSAEAALRVYFRDYPASWGLRKVERADLGDGGAIFKGPNPVGGAPQIVIVWRTGPYLLHIIATGSIEADADEIRQLAEGMQTRAEAASRE